MPSSQYQVPWSRGIEQNADGRQMLIFANPAQGQQAMAQLLQTSNYTNLTAQQAILRYSGNSYGAADVGLDPTANFGSQISDPTALQNLVSAISTREGFSSDGATGKGIGTTGNSAIDTTQQGFLPNRSQGRA